MRLILDTMIWSRVADANAQNALRRLFRDHDVELLAHSGLLEEIARNKNDRVRREQLATVFALSPQRLGHGSQVLSQELIGAIRTRRPEWMRSSPDLRVEARIRDNDDKLWRAARYRPDDFGVASRLVAARATDDNLAAQRITQDVMRKSRFPSPRLGTGSYEPTEADIAFFGGELPSRPSCEPWRLDVLSWWWERLVRVSGGLRVEGTGMKRQVAACVDLAAMFVKPGAFCTLLLDEVAQADLPRAWTNWAINFLQPNMKLSSSNLWDAQYALWFVDCDVFMTSDRRFAGLAEEVRNAAQFPMCRIILMPSTASVMGDVATGLASAQT
jgi:hypothetical protein